MALAERGEAGLADMLEHQTHMGHVLREALKASGWRIVNSTPLPVVCFTRDGLVPTALLAALRERQIAWMSEAKLGGVPVIRACITSFRTTERDIEWVVSEMNSLASDLTFGNTERPEPIAARNRVLRDGRNNETGDDRNSWRLQRRTDDEGCGRADLPDSRLCI